MRALRHAISDISQGSGTRGEVDAHPTGPLSGPSDTTWRRRRLLRIGSTGRAFSLQESADEITSFANNNSETSSYGTITGRRSPFTGRRPLGELRIVSDEPGVTSPLASPSLSFRRRASQFFLAERPISAYDHKPIALDENIDGRSNGIRVWYTSFSSIDWLHDFIKNSVRHARLRTGRKTSWRRTFRLAIDKSIGWIIVTLVGFLAAIIAFLVVRAEQFLFDIKSGYCKNDWSKAELFCCSEQEKVILPPLDALATKSEQCNQWVTWSEALGDNPRAHYAIYTCIAILLASLSCTLTVKLTASTSFTTRKESGVLGPDFVSNRLLGVTSHPSKPSSRRLMFYAAGSGIPEIKTILSGFVIHGYLGARVLLVKSVGLALSVASGLSLGKEGPMVHIASCIGNIISRVSDKYENNEAKRREILSAACAAGVSVAFGAPIGGTLFSLEEVSFFFPPKVMWRSFFCAMIAAITLRLLDPFGTGKLVLFQVTYDKDWHAYELFPFILLGVFGGMYGAIFSKLNYIWSKHVRNGTRLKTHPLLEVVVITLITTALAFVNPFTKMSGTALVYELFAECRTGAIDTHNGLCPNALTDVRPVISAIAITMLIKAALTVVTFGIKLPAGIFIPSLVVGACTGRITACKGDASCIVPGLYAMVGAAATLSGVTRTTVSLAVIMFELTDTLTYTVPVMLAVLVAKTVADALEPKGIYDLVIELTQLPFLDIKSEYIWGHVQVNDIMDRDVDVIYVDSKNTVESLRDRLQKLLASGQDDGGFPILKTTRDGLGHRLVGFIGASELEHALSIVADHGDDEVLFHTQTHTQTSVSVSSLDNDGINPFDLSVYMDEAPLCIQSNAPLEGVHQFFKWGAKYVVVTDYDGDYEGVIDKKSWLSFLSELESQT